MFSREHYSFDKKTKVSIDVVYDCHSTFPSPRQVNERHVERYFNVHGIFTPPVRWMTELC